MNNSLGNNIKAFRKNKGLTQEELAGLLNVTPQAVSRWESEVGMPDVAMIIPLAQILGVSTDALLGYDMIREDSEVTNRIKETVRNMYDEKDRAGSKLKICEYLSTETNIHPGNYEIVKEYVQQTGSLSMYWDEKLEGCYKDQDDHIREIFKDSIKKGTYLISHCTDRDLIDKTHYSIAWIYIHMKDFDKAKEHINVLPGLNSTCNREVLEMETVYFDKGFDQMKEVIDSKNRLLFSTVARQFYTVAQNYGWWGDKDEALEMISWCDGIIEAFATRLDAIDSKDYMHIRYMNAFHKMIALKRAGDDAKAAEVYSAFVNEVNEMADISDELKKESIAVLDREIGYYGKFS